MIKTVGELITELEKYPGYMPIDNVIETIWMYSKEDIEDGKIGKLYIRCKPEKEG